MIELSEVVKRYAVGSSEVEILKHVSLQVWPGEFVAIVGPSGSGKSTLLNMITGIDRPSGGEVVVLGERVHKLSENKLARWRGQHVGIVFQFYQLLPALSLLKNVILPMDLASKYRPRERRERAHYLLDLVGIADQADKLPSMVSGGQQQRAAIARALANDPPLVVADEPTGNLDQATAHSIFDLFHRFVADGKTMVVVTHDRELACSAPRVIELANGWSLGDRNGPAESLRR